MANNADAETRWVRCRHTSRTNRLRTFDRLPQAVRTALNCADNPYCEACVERMLKRAWSPAALLASIAAGDRSIANQWRHRYETGAI